MTLPEVTIYTDGGCSPNPGPGGWGAVVLPTGGEPRELAGSEGSTTNNRMELQAAIEALRSLDGPHRVSLHTDSEYLRQGITQWLPGWRRSGWKTSQRTPVKNQDLWTALDQELERHRVTWRWVRGHSGDRWNERADELATGARAAIPLPLSDPAVVHLFPAASFSGKTGTGGWGVILRHRGLDKELCGRVERTSANRMQLLAAVCGFEALRRPLPVRVYTASSYLRDGATSWLPAWKRREWQTRDGRPVSHRDLWQRLESLAARHRVTWHLLSDRELPPEATRAKELSKQALRGEEAS